jgi:hypothetical protein
LPKISNENLTIRYDVIDAMFRQIQTTETKKYKTILCPGKYSQQNMIWDKTDLLYLDKRYREL